jgi:biopolymer transport protein ExbD
MRRALPPLLALDSEAFMASKVLTDSDEGVIAEINIVPFVDIVLVLLITFMLTSSAIVRASSLNVVLDRKGGLFLDGKPTTPKDLAAHVAKASWKNEKLQAVISADRSIDYGRVVQVIDIVKSNGIKSFALNIQREQ